MKNRLFIAFFLLVASMLITNVRAGTTTQPTASMPNLDSKRVVSENARQDLNIIWFGHSLLRFDTEPPVDIPNLVTELHRSAIGQQTTPPPIINGISKGHAEGPHHFSYWLDGKGDALNKIRQPATQWDYVVGVGFMHLLGQHAFDWPRLYHWLNKVDSKRFKSQKLLTQLKYRFIRLVETHAAKATWVNYVGPALSNNTTPQAAIDDRFECIRQTAQQAGIKIINVPVGNAFRNAEAAAILRPELNIKLQRDDHLHLTTQGALLTASIFYHQLYQAPLSGLPVPASYLGQLADTDEEAVAQFLYDIAESTVQQYAPNCRPEKRLTEDDEGLLLLKSVS